MKKTFLILSISISTISFAQSFNWANKGGKAFNDKHDIGQDVITDNASNSYVTGTFAGSSVIFNGTSGPSISLNSFGGTNDIFISQYNVAGVVQWVTQAGSSTGFDEGYGITYDAINNFIYVTGSFEGVATFGSTTLTSTLDVFGNFTKDIFVAKLNPVTGAFVWAMSVGSDEDDEGLALDVDVTGANAYVTGYFGAFISFGLTSLGIPAIPEQQIFIAKLNLATAPAPTAWLWAEEAGASGGADAGKGISVGKGAVQDIFLTGYFNANNSPASFGSFTLTGFAPPPSDMDIFVARYNPSGTCVWAVQAGAPQNPSLLGIAADDVGNDVAVDASGNCYCTGYFFDVATFGTITVAATNVNHRINFYVAKLNPAGAFQWVRFNSYTPERESIGDGVCVDANDFPYVTGYFEGHLTLNPLSLAAFGSNGAETTVIFVAKLNPATGNSLWLIDAPQTTSPGFGGGALDFLSQSVAVAPDCRVYTAGGFDHSPQFGATTLSVSPAFGGTPTLPNTDMFIAQSNKCIVNVTPSVADVCPPPNNCITLTANCTCPPPCTFTWSPATGLSATTGASVNACPTVTTTYTVTVTDMFGCTNSTTVTITVHPAPNITVSPANPTVCSTCTPPATLTASGGVTYTWVPATGLSATTGASVNACPPLTTTYTVTGTDVFGCTNTATVTVTVVPAPVASFTYSINCIGTGNSAVVTFTNTSSNATSYFWNFGSTTFAVPSTSTATNPVVTYIAPGTYTVTLTATGNPPCSTSTQTQIITIVTNCCAYNPPTPPFDIVSGVLTGTGNCASPNIYTWQPPNNFAPFAAGTPGVLRIEKTLTIQNGAKLIIQNFGLTNPALEFGPEGKIIVEPGGKLEIRVSMLNSICALMWQGIEVWGNPALTQVCSNQGEALITGSYINNAHIGVLVGARNICPPPIDCAPTFIKGGGILTVEGGAKFNLCAVGVRFAPYLNVNSNISKIWQSTQFNGGTLLDIGYNTSSPYTYPNAANPFNAPANATGRSAFGIYEYRVKDVTIDDCDFDNIERGITMLDSKQDVTNCTFNNHLNAIGWQNTGTTLLNTHTISTNIFIDNIYYGIYSIGGRYDWIDKENIFNPAPSNTNQAINNFAIWLRNTGGFQVVDNSFSYHKYGVVSTHSYTAGGFIGTTTNNTDGCGNDFNRCFIGVRAGWGPPTFVFQNNSKLIIKCNCHPNTDLTAGVYDKNWRKTGSLANQGYTTIPLSDKTEAGNEFTPFAAPNIRNHLANDGGNVFVYTRHSLSPCNACDITSFPFVTSVTETPTIVPKSPTTSCYDPCAGNPSPCRLAQIAGLQSEINSLTAEYNSVLANLDNGQTTTLLNAIYSNMSFGDLKDLLNDNSPLSDTVLLAFIIHTVPPPGIFKNVVMIPNMPVSDKVWEPLLQLLATYPSSIADQIIEAQSTSTTRTLTAIARDLDTRESSRQVKLNEVIAYDIRNNAVQDAIDLLVQENNNYSKQILFGTYLENGQFSSAFSVLNAFVPADQDETDWKQLSQILLELAFTNKTLFDMRADQIQTVRNIAQGFEGTQARANARTILYVLYYEEFSDELDETSSPSLRTAEPIAEQIPQNGFINAVPNPFSNFTMVEYALPSRAVTASVEIFDVTGKKLKSFPLVELSGKLQVSAEDLNNGVYFYSLIANDKIIQTKKFIIIKQE